MAGAVSERGRIAGAEALAASLRYSRARIGAAVVYHRVDDPAEDPARHLVPALGKRLFEAQLRHIARCYQPVRASELLDAVESRRPGGRIPVAVTFDDDLESHARVAAPALLEAGVPATFFVSGDDEPPAGVRWWQDLQLAVAGGLLTRDSLGPALRDALGNALARTPRGIHDLARAIRDLPPGDRASIVALLHKSVARVAPEPALTLSQIQELADRGFEIGFHTRRHLPLPTLDDDELAAELTDGVATLEQACDHPVASISYPHGLADQRVIEAAARAGFSVGFTTTPEAVGPRTDRLLVGRIPPSFVSLGAFAAMMARGLLSARDRA